MEASYHDPDEPSGSIHHTKNLKVQIRKERRYRNLEQLRKGKCYLKYILHLDKTPGSIVVSQTSNIAFNERLI